MSKNKNRPAPAVVRALVRPREGRAGGVGTLLLSPPNPADSIASEASGGRESPVSLESRNSGLTPAARLWRRPILVAPAADFPEWHGGPWPLDEADLPDAPPADAPPADDKPLYVGTFRALLRMGASLDPIDMEVRISPFNAVEIGPLLLQIKQAQALRRLIDIAMTAAEVAV